MSTAEVLDFDPRDRGERPLANMDAEHGVLGAALCDNGLVAELDGLEARHFAEGAHARLWLTITDLVGAQQIADPVTVAQRLNGDPGLIEFGGLVFLADLVDKAPGRGVAAQYARMIRDLATARDLIRLADMATSAVRKGEPAASALSGLESGLLALRTGQGRAELATAAEGAAGVLADLDAPETADGGISTGLEPLDEHLGQLLPDDLVLVAGRPGMGKAQPVNRLVLSPRGWVRMGDLRPGDEVCEPGGKIQRVIGVHPQGMKPVFRVTFADDRWTEATADHLWTVRMRAKWASEEKVITTKELAARLARTRHKGRTSVELARPSFGDRPQSALDPYCLGLLLGDGTFRGGERSVQFCSADPELIDALAAAFPGVSPSGHYLRGRTTHVRLTTPRGQPNPLLEEISALGLEGRGSATKFVPVEFLQADDATRLGVLQGLLDTDGTVELSGTIRFSTISPELARDVVYLARSLGALARLRSRQTYFGAEHKAGAPSFIVTIRHPDGRSLFRLERKRRRVPENYQYADLRLQVRNIAEVGEAECQCITVSGERGLYVTDGFIVTHNSAIGACIALNVSERGIGVIEINSEMTVKQMMRRHLTDLCFGRWGKDAPTYKDIRRRRVSPSQRGMLEWAAEQASALPLAMVKRTGLTVSALRSLAKRQATLWEGRGIRLGLVTVDHVGLLKADGGGKDRYTDQTDIAIGMKALADELHVPVIALVQLNREVEKRDGRKPQLSDLRDTGAWEENADTVIGMYRDAYYALKEAEPPLKGDGLKWNEWSERRQSKVIEAILLKVREGEEGVVKLWASIGHNAIRGADPTEGGGFL